MQCLEFLLQQTPNHYRMLPKCLTLILKQHASQMYSRIKHNQIDKTWLFGSYEALQKCDVMEDLITSCF